MAMGMYPLEELIRKWGRGELTVEQAIGQILLWLQWLERGERDEIERGDRERRGEKQR
jgi:hypothetical protein